jgi:glycosyltransferase involved in cell wall biosynthesis
MRVLFALESYLPHYGGEEVRIHNLSTRLPQSWDTHVVSPRFDESPTEEEDASVRVHRLGKYRSDSYFKSEDRSLSASIDYGIRLRRFVSKEPFDVVMFGQWNMLHYFLAGRQVRCPKIIDWCEVLSGELDGFRGLGESILERNLTRGAGRHVASSDFLKAKLSLVHGVDPERISVVQNGVSEDALVAIRPEKDPGAILYVGRLMPHKRIELLLDAIHLLRGQGTDIRLRIVGNGQPAYVKHLEARADSCVSFLGNLASDRLKEEYNAARVLVLPSRREGSSLVSLEAMASWTPVITVNTSLNESSHDIVGNGYNGLVVHDSVESITRAIAMILQDEEVYGRLSRNAFETAKGRTWERMAVTLTKIFESVVLEGPTPRMPLEPS